MSTVPLTYILASPDGPAPMYDDTFDLVARRTSTAPVVDGTVDSVWDGAEVLRAQTQGESGVPVIKMRALFDDDYIYILSSWDEPVIPVTPSEDVMREAWELRANSSSGAWDHKDWGEDRISFFFEDPDEPVDGFETQGCDGICHDLVDMHTKSADEMLDTWVWSAATTNPQGYADDGVLKHNNSVTKDPKRMHVTLADLDWDPGADGWWVNNDTANATERPTHVWKPGASPADARFMFMDDAMSVDWDTFDASVLAAGTIVPGHVLMTPSGDRADVEAKGVFNGTGWNVEFKRLRDTGSSNDVAFDETNVAYVFSPAYTNNETGDKHSKGIHEYYMWLAEPDRPDLVVENILPMGTSHTVNSTVSVGVFVENIGWSDAVASRLSASWDEPNAPEALLVDVPSVAWGLKQYVSFDVSTENLTAGNNTLLIEVDAEGVVNEINETNNADSREVELAAEPLPNLMVDGITIDPEEIATGGYVDVTVAVSNDGTMASPAGTEIVMYLEDIEDPVATTTLQAIPIGGSFDWDYNWGPIELPVGTHVLNATVDPDGDVKETDETDNDGAAQFNVTAPTLPDLVIEDVTPINGTVTQGDETRTQVVVANEGGDAVTSDFQVELWLDEAFSTGTTGLIATADVTEDIPAGGNAIVVLVWTVPVDADVGSDHFLRAEVDRAGAVEELDDTNNNGTYEGLVVLRKQLPDLTVTGVAPSGPTLRKGERVTFNITVANEGGADSSINTTLLVKDLTHNESIDSLNVPAIAVGASEVLQYEWFVDVPTTGTITIQFLADPLNHIDEDDEFNNALDIQVTVEPPKLPDLSIPEDGITFFPEVPRLGEAVSISCTVKNSGTNSTGETTTLGVWLGNNRILQTEMLPLGAGESRTLDLTWPANEIQSPMTYRLVFRIDPDGSIDELDPSNNEREENITFVKPPAAVLENLRVVTSVERVEEGESFTLTVTLNNTGDAADLITISIKDGVASLASRQGVTVPAGGSASEDFELELEGTGDHSLSVTIYRGSDIVQDPSGQDMVGSVSVKAVEKEDDGGGMNLMIVVIVIVVLVIAGVAAYFVLGRK